METLPAWANPLWQSCEGQVAHGLNLALPLECPWKLPLVLWTVSVAKPKVQRALDELSFVHDARFVPSWDGTALMVTTTFDGPLEPYVMDFAIAIGDVFDALLAFVDKDMRPPLPIREHPDAFMAFVRRWNRPPMLPSASRFGRSPERFDYPVYSAYPRQTVVEIAGPRAQLPPPAIDRPAAKVDLNDVQGNILQGYRAKHAIHLFFEIVDCEAARVWLGTSLTYGDSAWPGVTSASPWTDKPRVVTNVAFTYPGLLALLPHRERDLARFPLAFREGATARHAGNGDVGPSAPEGWRFGRPDQRIHVVVSIHAFEQDVAAGADPVCTAILAGAQEHGLVLTYEHRAQALDYGFEYFGYVDGFANPRISGQRSEQALDFQPAASPGEFLLGASYRNIYGGSSLGDLPADLACNGTFGALRLLEQHRDAFDATIAAESQRVGIEPTLLKAKLVGRWPGGWPVSLASDAKTPDRNAFDFAPSWEYPEVFNDHQGTRCPVGAHVRRCNPRSARVAGQAHTRRLIRRGLPSSWTEGSETKSGLLGLFIGASLERQFEFIQREWIQGDLAAGGIRRGLQDPIAGLRSTTTEFDIPCADGVKTVMVPPLVTTRGSLYLFFPSLSMLRRLSQAGGSPGPAYEHAADTRLASASPWSYPLRWPQWVRRLSVPWLVAAVDALIAWGTRQPWFETLVRDLTQRRGEGCAVPPDPHHCVIDMLASGFLIDPCATYAKLRRAKQSVVWVPQHNAWWVLARQDAQRLFAEPENFLQVPAARTRRGILTMDPPRHTAVRHVLGEALQAATRNLQEYIDDAVAAALKRIEGLDHFDAVRDYADAVPAAVLARVIGIPLEQLDAFEALARTSMLHYGRPERHGVPDRLTLADAGLRMALRFLRLLLRARFAKGAFEGTLIGEIARHTCLVRKAPSATLLSPAEAAATLVQVLLAARSARFLLGTTVRNLLLPDTRHDPACPTPWVRLARRCADGQRFGALVARAIDETRRVDPPVTLVERCAARRLEIGGVTVEEGAPVLAVVASANRDLGPGARDPEHFHWNRVPRVTNMSLGGGIHRCVGEALQSKLVPTALERLIEKMPDLQLVDRTAVPAWFDNVYFRCLESLPVKRSP